MIKKYIFPRIFFGRKIKPTPNTKYEIISDEIDHEGPLIPRVWPKIGVEFVKKTLSMNDWK